MPAYRTSTYLVYAFQAHSTSFSPNFNNPQQWNVDNCESELLLVVGIRFVLPWYDCSRLTESKTSSICLSAGVELILGGATEHNIIHAPLNPLSAKNYFPVELINKVYCVVLYGTVFYILSMFILYSHILCLLIII